MDRRNESLSALQALALLNNDFMVTMARHFAERAGAIRGRLAGAGRVAASTAGAGPAADRGGDGSAGRLRRKYGLANACRVMFNLNEFVFVD